MAGGAAVGVDDDLAAGQPRVSDGPADHELAGRVDHEVLEQLLLGVELLVLGVEHRLEHVLPEVVADHLLPGLLAVLGRDQDLGDLDRPIVLISDGDLGLAVGTEIGHHPRLADLGELARELVGDLDRHRHQRLRLRGWRSRTSFPGRLPRRRRARPRTRPRAARSPCRRPARCRATARRSRSARHRPRGRSRSEDRRSRSGESSRGRSSGCRRSVLVVISPETTTRPVFTSVSQATRPSGPRP